MTTQIIADVTNIKTTENDWFIGYNNETRRVMIGPIQCSGNSNSCHVMAIADTEEELLEFIEQEGLTLEDTDDDI